MTVIEIPPHVEEALSEAVARRLEGEFRRHELLLAPSRAAAAEVALTEHGARLLGSTMRLCYALESDAELEFESEETAERLAVALAFGAATAAVLARGAEITEALESLCAVFNLGIGLVDSVCDADAERGADLLALVAAQDLVDAAERPRERGWLRRGLPPALARDHTVSFTVEIIETFFATLHAVHPGAARSRYRRRVGKQLQVALEAERRSVVPPAGTITRERLVESSRLTSVVPFEIIEALACGDHPVDERNRGRLLGEAMWRIDDLVDLCQDARAGALNSLLTAGTDGAAADLEQLLVSSEISRVAAEAAENLRSALRGVPDRAATPFQYLVQRYARIS